MQTYPNNVNYSDSDSDLGVDSDFGSDSDSDISYFIKFINKKFISAEHHYQCAAQQQA
jgi:hypothetical protein